MEFEESAPTGGVRCPAVPGACRAVRQRVSSGGVEGVATASFGIFPPQLWLTVDEKHVNNFHLATMRGAR